METQQLKEKILQSIHLYEQMLEYMKKLEMEIGTASPAALTKFNATLSEHFTTAEKIEHDLFVQLSTSSDKVDEFKSLIEMRENILKDILLLNQQITSKASGIRSFISHKTKSLQSGFSAMKGYKQAYQNQGRIVNSTS